MKLVNDTKQINNKIIDEGSKLQSELEKKM